MISLRNRHKIRTPKKTPPATPGVNSRFSDGCLTPGDLKLTFGRLNPKIA